MSQDPTSADTRALEMCVQGHWSYRTLHDYFVDAVQSAPDRTALLVLPGRPNMLRAQVEHTLSRKGMEFRMAVETDTQSRCMELARQGVGYTVVPACAVYQHGLGDTISWAPVRGMYLTWALCENQARTHSQAVREGRRLAIHTVSESLASRSWFGAERLGSSILKAEARA